jgi:hypothetical protein
VGRHPKFSTMRLEISAPFLGSLNGKHQSVPGGWHRKFQTHRINNCVTSDHLQHLTSLCTVQVYGFYDECLQKYGSADVWAACASVFDTITLSIVVEGKVRKS